MFFPPADSPVFVVPAQDVTGNNGRRVSLQCTVDSNPPADYLWIKNNLSSEVSSQPADQGRSSFQVSDHIRARPSPFD